MYFKIDLDDDGDVELYIGGQFQGSWDHSPRTVDGVLQLPEWVVLRMLECAFDEGKRKRSKEIMELLR